MAKEIKRNWWFDKLYNGFTEKTQGALLTKARKIYNANCVIDFSYENSEPYDDNDNSIEFNSKVLSLANNEDIYIVSFTVSNEENRVLDKELFLYNLLIKDNKLTDIIDLWNNDISEDFINNYLKEKLDIDVFISMNNLKSISCDCQKFNKSGKICEHILASVLVLNDEINYNPQILFDLIGLTKLVISNKLFSTDLTDMHELEYADFIDLPFYMNYENGFISKKNTDKSQNRSDFSEKEKYIFHNNFSSLKEYYGLNSNEYMLHNSINKGNLKNKKTKEMSNIDFFNYVDKVDSVYYNTIAYIKAVISSKKK